MVPSAKNVMYEAPIHKFKYWSNINNVWLDYWSNMNNVWLDYWSNINNVWLDYWSNMSHFWFTDHDPLHVSVMSNYYSLLNDFWSNS